MRLKHMSGAVDPNRGPIPEPAEGKVTELPFLPPDTGVMLCGHGSRNQRAVGEFAVLADALKARLPGVPVEYGYLEFANPVIHQGLDRLAEQGVKHVLAVPGMLFAAGHAKNDIPAVLKTYEATHPGRQRCRVVGHGVPPEQ